MAITIVGIPWARAAFNIAAYTLLPFGQAAVSRADYLGREDIEGVGYAYGDLAEYTRRYDPAKLRDGWNDVAGERVFYVSNPALGLWAWKGRFA